MLIGPGHRYVSCGFCAWRRNMSWNNNVTSIYIFFLGWGLTPRGCRVVVVGVHWQLQGSRHAAIQQGCNDLCKSISTMWPLPLMQDTTFTGVVHGPWWKSPLPNAGIVVAPCRHLITNLAHRSTHWLFLMQRVLFESHAIIEPRTVSEPAALAIPHR